MKMGFTLIHTFIMQMSLFLFRFNENVFSSVVAISQNIGGMKQNYCLKVHLHSHGCVEQSFPPFLKSVVLPGTIKSKDDFCHCF